MNRWLESNFLRRRKRLYCDFRTLQTDPNWALTFKETRYFWRCHSSPAGLPLEPPYADRALRGLVLSKLKGLALSS